MVDLCRLVWWVVAGLFRSRAALHAEILVLRHQLNVLRRKSPKRFVFSNLDRMVFAGLYPDRFGLAILAVISLRFPVRSIKIPCFVKKIPCFVACGISCR